jgi:PAS domain S-box-containing protein
MTLTEKKLKESEERFKALFKASPVPTYAWQKVGDTFKLIDCNNAADIITQGNIKNFLGFKASEMYRERSDILEDLNSCFEKKTTIDREMKYVFSSTKEEKDLLVKYVFLQPDLVLVHTEDITARRRAEEKVQYQAKLVEDVPDAIISTDLDFNIITWNKAGEDIYGWKAEEVIGKGLREIIPIEYPYEEEVVLKKFFEEGFWKGEVIQKHKDGKPINILASVSLIKDIVGNPKGAVIINHNITERKKSEEALRESEEKFRTLTEQSFLGVAILQNNFIRYVNTQLAHTFGYTVEEVMNWGVGGFINVIHSEDRQMVNEQAKKKQFGESDVVNQYQFRGISI